jgi:predicted metal-dependent phosphoesterase TrpH
MPRGQPFTALCRLAARLSEPRAADLHVHTTASDGDYTPSQVVALARQARLAAVAVTDHDTLAGVGPAVETAAGALEVIAGVELSAEFGGREVHLLGYFVRRDDARLVSHLEDVCDRRRERFRAFVARLAAAGIEFADGLAELEAERSASLGRRHLTGLLVRVGAARSRYGAFQRFLRPLSPDIPAGHLTPAAEAIRLVRDAGGVCSLAHPPEGDEEPLLTGLRDLGLLAVEAAFPAAGVSRSERLRALARKLGLAVTGGSDCHGPEAAGRAVGARGISRDELAALRHLAGSAGSGGRVCHAG